MNVKFGGRSAARRRILVPAVVPVAFVVLAACGGSAFHEQWEAGRYEAAAATFRADSTLRADGRALYRMALLQLSPELSFHDPAAARENLEAALELDPEPAVRRGASVLLELAGQVIRLRDQLEALKSIDLDQVPADTTARR